MITFLGQVRERSFSRRFAPVDTNREKTVQTVTTGRLALEGLRGISQSNLRGPFLAPPASRANHCVVREGGLSQTPVELEVRLTPSVRHRRHR